MFFNQNLQLGTVHTYKFYRTNTGAIQKNKRV